jgi:outer membrane protein assembly factor BamB
MAGVGCPGRLRAATAAVGVFVLVAGLITISWRVLRPATMTDRSASPYPRAAAFAEPTRYASLPHAPLILDGRLRIFAEKRRVWADTAVTSKTEINPYWAYRRWPGQLVGVVGVEPAGTHPGPVVVSQWSDGTVVGIDARSGQVAWHKRIAVHDPNGYVGRRTGARTVYDPRGLYTASTAGGTPVLVVGGQSGAAGYDPWTGARRWHRPAACRDRHAGWTGATTYVARCGDRLDILDAATGRQIGSWTGRAPRPWACALGHSGCRMVASASANYRLGPDGAMTPATWARSAKGFLSGDGYVDWRRDSTVRLVDATTGEVRWEAPLHGYVIGADADFVYLVTWSHWVVALDAKTGIDRARVPVPARRDWHAGYVFARHGLVVVERVVGSPDTDDDQYYYSMTSIALLGT